MTSRSATEGSVRRELAQNDLERPPRELISGDDPHDRLAPDDAPGSRPTARNAGARTDIDVERAEPNERQRIVLLPRDESALDGFASERGVLGVPAPSPVAATHQAAIAYTTEPIQHPAIGSASEPIGEPAVASATAPLCEDVRRSSVRRPRTALRERSFAAPARTASDVELAERDERMRIVWLSRDEAALDAFASESGLLDVPAPSPTAATHQPAIASATEPIQHPAIGSASKPLREPAVKSATAPIREDVRRSSVRRPRTALRERSFAAPARTASDVELAERDERMRIAWLPRDESALDGFASESGRLDVPAPSPSAATHQAASASATEAIREDLQRGSVRRPRAAFQRSIFAALAIGVICGSMAGLYVRRHPASLAATPLPVHDETSQVPIAAPASETASPPENSQTATAAVNEQLVPPGDQLPGARGIELRQAPSPGATTIPDATPASARQETPTPGPPRAASQNLSPSVGIASIAQTPPTLIHAVATSGTDASSRERSDGSEVPSTPQTMPVAARAPLEASVIPSAAANPVTPLAATSLTTARERTTEATPVVVEVADEQRITAVLKRFTDAYTQLNAPAAKAVSPSVDSRALSRAFDALESQSIAFDDCTVHVSGAEARAACVGNLTYVPKIGRRSARTVTRHWNFVMKKNSEGWTITDAQMR